MTRRRGPQGHRRCDRGRDDSVQEGDRPEIDSELFDQSARHLQLVVVGIDGLGGFAGVLLGCASTDVVPAACIRVIVARQH